MTAYIPFCEHAINTAQDNMENKHSHNTATVDIIKATKIVGKIRQSIFYRPIHSTTTEVSS